MKGHEKILLALFFLCGISLSAQDKIEGISWSEKELTWNYFKGTPDYSKPYSSITYSGISIKYLLNLVNDDLVEKYEIIALFFPDKSWVIQRDTTPELLKHERLHFDIAEIYARKLRKVMREISFESDEQHEYSHFLQNQILFEFRMTQLLYDAETNHSRNREEQKKWKERIARELQELDAWRKD